MRIANNIIIIAVVSLAAYAFGWQRGTPLSNSSEYFDRSADSEEISFEDKSLSRRESLMLLSNEGGGGRGIAVDCCPSILEIVEPKAGINQEEKLVELYSEGDIPQRFYELSCREGVAGQPCRFMERKLQNQSRCVQKYSFTYAIVKETDYHVMRQNRLALFLRSNGVHGGFYMDYIRVRSGCSCEVIPKVKRKRNGGGNRRNKNKLKSYENDD